MAGQGAASLSEVGEMSKVWVRRTFGQRNVLEVNVLQDRQSTGPISASLRLAFEPG